MKIQLRAFRAPLMAGLALLLGAIQPASHAITLPVTLPVMACADLLKVDLSRLKDAPTRLNTAVVESPAGGAAVPTPECVISGYVAPEVQFMIRLPLENWTGRMLMKGCGGYCGNLITLPTGYNASAADRCPRIVSGELAVAAHNGGHVGNTNGGRFLAAISDGMWAIDNPDGLIDFFYRSNHKATVAAKAVIEAFYGQPARYSYFDGCSSGGRAALHIAQRYPDDYDGILAGAPTIDNTATNTFSHSWNVRVNRAPDGKAILTNDKIPALAGAVLAACADNSGMIQDPRACRFNAESLLCSGADGPSCLTPEQARAANQIYQGPVDQRGRLLAPGGMPYGSELAWAGSIALAKGVIFSADTSSEFAFSYDFPNYMSNFFTTGITNANIKFTSRQFDYLHALSGLNDPTNPDLSGFARRGGKLIVWQGWADSGTSPFGTLSYHDIVRRTLSPGVVDQFMSVYMIPGVYHCAGGPFAASLDMLTPLMAWVEDQAAPGRQVVSYHASGSTASAVTRTRPVFPYPATAKYTGQGDVNSAANYAQGPATMGVSEVLEWAGLANYRPGAQLWCSTGKDNDDDRERGRTVGTSLVCRPNSR
jgi:hypothetical protein